MGANNAIAPIMLRLSDQQRNFVITLVRSGDAAFAKSVSGYADSVHASQVLREPGVAAALRWETARQLATEGAQIGFGTLKRIAQDPKAPAAAQVAAAARLLQGAGLLDAPSQDKESKSINDMSREELRSYIESKRADIDKMEKELADRATDITPVRDSEPQNAVIQAIDPFG